MSGFYGMDTQQVRDHSAACRTGMNRIEELRGALDGAVTSVTWEGPDADSFRDQWLQLSSGRISGLLAELEGQASQLEGEADQQDVVSDRDGTESGPGTRPSTIPDAPTDRMDRGYLHEDNPWIPNWLENPAEQLFSDTAGLISDGIGWGSDLLMDGISTIGDRLGLNMDGFDQFRRDGEHLRDVMTDWATGERVPTISEVLASTVLTAGSGGVAVYEALTGNDTAFLDDRPGGIVHDVTTSTDPAPSPQTLQDLILDNNALRMDNPEAAPLESGQIGIQEVHNSRGGDPVYIVQIPPTEGAGIGTGDAWGAQGNSRDWASNLRLVAGQHPAAMDDVRAAMDAAGIPPGSNVMLVGHSQGGIVGSHLASDPNFNSASGADGTYNVTHAFSVGSPVQTVLPAQGGTEVVNVTHGPASLGWPSSTGDHIAHLDLQGTQIGGGRLQAPNLHEVVLPGTAAPTSGAEWLHVNHDSVGPENSADGGYAGTLGRSTDGHPVLGALQDDLTGVYMGDGTYVSESHVVTVGREHIP
ncbi:MAG: hypothetical protein DI611_09810 [Brachybacterium faecium]|nr:MAG: hypothetical protein DI611_09810 [Brachybacterium faecium]